MCKRHGIAIGDNYMFKLRFYCVCCIKCCKCVLLLRFVVFRIFVHYTPHIGCAIAVALFKTNWLQKTFSNWKCIEFIIALFCTKFYRMDGQKTKIILGTFAPLSLWILSFPYQIYGMFLLTTFLHFTMILDIPQNHAYKHTQSKIYLPISVSTNV